MTKLYQVLNTKKYLKSGVVMLLLSHSLFQNKALAYGSPRLLKHKGLFFSNNIKVFNLNQVKSNSNEYV